MKNSTRIGSSLLGTWTAQTELSNHNDKLNAYFIAHFMADYRRFQGCSLDDCKEVDNKACMFIQDEDGHNAKKTCRNIAQEKDMPWSDITAFFYFGVQVDSDSSPKAHFEMSTGDWVGPYSIILAQELDNDSLQEGEDPQKVLVDRYVARYVQSQSVVPPFLQNAVSPKCTLYNLEDDYAAFLGSTALSHMTSTQTNWSGNNATIDPYAPYLQTCKNGDVQPILPQLELTFVQNNKPNSTDNGYANKSSTDQEEITMEMNLQYKIMAVPSPSELAYRVLPHLQSRFQGHGGYNILSGPYCYGDDALRGYSVDLNFSTAHSLSGGQATFERACMDSLPCTPPAAMGGLPILPGNGSCDNHNGHHHRHHHNGGPMGGLSMALAIGCYSLGVALLMSLMFIRRQSAKYDQDTRRYRQREQDEAALFLPVEDSALDGDIPPEVEVNEEGPTLFGRMNLLKSGGGKAEEPVGPFGDLDQADNQREDPLREPLLEQREVDVNEAASSVASREDA